MTDSSQGGNPPQNPYGGQGSSGENPYGRPPGEPPTQPFGQPSGEPASNPYAQPPASDPYGAPPAGNPYGQPAQGQPVQGQQPYGHYSSPYGGQQQQPGPLGDGLDMYGRPLNRKVTDGRPGTVTAAGWITLVVAGLTGLLYGFITLAMIVAKDDVLAEIDKAITEQGTSDFDAEAAFGIVLVVLLILFAWCVIACVLAVFAMRRSKVSRILLVISAVVVGLFSLLITLTGGFIAVLWLAASVAVVVMLFAGGASEWYRDRY